ncbi:MAG: thermonuclease family protein [Candidatus Aenigmarchaeota archaeon]|nr:thermonuclease family protein [Candidatus Aenigmarchaeota archaeon]
MSVRRKIKRVVDGDTLELYTRIGNSRFVRLSGVNAPEKHERGGRTATNMLRGMVGGRTVTIRPEARDIYGRVVGTVISDWRNVNARMRRKLWML